MKIALAAALLVCALELPQALRAAEQSESPRAKDAAQAVQEGNVSNWLKYYQREREQGGAANPPGGEPVPAPVGAPAPQPAERR